MKTHYDKHRKPVVGFTIGVFDLYHEGHRNHLQEALKHCDLLLVGVVDDYHTRLQKGPNRPVEGLSARMNKIREEFPQEPLLLIPVDCLVLPLCLRSMIDIAFPGEDQLPKFYSISEHQFPQMRVIERTPGVSTTILLSKGKEP
jgi:cytidyltransferase-like protein